MAKKKKNKMQISKLPALLIGGIVAVGIIAVFLTFSSSSDPSYAASYYFNGFEKSLSGWNEYEGGTVTKVRSAHNDVRSADGKFHGVLGTGDVVSGGVYDGERIGPYTDWGGYESVFPEDGYVTQLDVYLDMDEADGTEKNFDFSSAVNKPDGTHRRDFIFHVGTTSEPGKWVIGVSNNAPGNPENSVQHTAGLDTTDWYTFQHNFVEDNSGNLKVIMQIYTSDGEAVGGWTLSNPSDIIGDTVGGNRYGWFATNDFEELPIDNTEKYAILDKPNSKEDCRYGGWQKFTETAFKSQGDCIKSVLSNDSGNAEDKGKGKVNKP